MDADSQYRRLDGRRSACGSANTNRSILGGYTPANAFTSSFTYTPTSKTVLSARYGYKYLNDKGNTYGLPRARWCFMQGQHRALLHDGRPQYPRSSRVRLESRTSATRSWFCLTSPPATTSTWMSQMFASSGQQHTFKGGYSENRIANRLEDDYPDGRFDIFWGTDFSARNPLIT